MSSYPPLQQQAGEQQYYRIFTKYVRRIDEGRLRLLNAFYLATHPISEQQSPPKELSQEAQPIAM